MAESTYRHYDHRLKYLVSFSRNSKIVDSMSIPKSTVASWIKNGNSQEGQDLFDYELPELWNKVAELQIENEILNSKLLLLKKLMNILILEKTLGKSSKGRN